MNTKKYFLTITYTNGEKETHRSNSEDYIKRLIRGMYDQSGSMYQKYWRARIDCNVFEYDM